MLIYDWLIHFPDELRCFWNIRRGRKLTAATVLYMQSRYPLIILTLFAVLSTSPMSDIVRNK